MKKDWWKKKEGRFFEMFPKLLLALGIFLVIILSLLIGRQPYSSSLHEGDIALRPIYAPFDFTYDGEPDEAGTEQLRIKAREAVSDVFSKDPAVGDNIKASLEAFFKRIAQAKGREGIPEEQLAEELQPQVKISVSKEVLLNFIKAEDIAAVKSAALRISDSIFSKDIISTDEKRSLSASDRKKITVRQLKGRDETPVNVRQLWSVDKAKHQIKESTVRAIKGNKRLNAALTDVVQAMAVPNLTFDINETESRKQEAAKAIPLQYQQVEVKKQELLVGKGQKITKLHLEQLTAIGQRQTQQSAWALVLAFAVLTFLFLSMLAFYLKFFEPDVYTKITDLLLMTILVSGLIIMARFIIISPWPSYSIPFAAVSILLALLINPRVAITVTILSSVVIGIMVGNNINLTTTFLLGGLAGIFSSKDARQRYHLLRAGFLVGGTNFLAIAGIGLLNNLGYSTYTTEGFWGFLNGIGCAFITMGLLPVFERLFKKTTNITLLELSDMGQPLLKNLVLRAPGTYHHSLIVGNLAEAACETIGANSLLARVGSYYHDIGKIEKPEYFSENQEHVESAHEKLTLSMSRLVITNHVKDGVDLGRKHGLSPAILDFVGQHHGTSLIYYFYQRALEEIEDEGVLKEEGFRYPGPKPQTKETATVLLADSVEAASRTLQNPTAPRIEDLVHRIINNKFIDGQLDECPLTLKDLHRIAQAFNRVLTSIFHTRIEYPKEE